MRVVCGSGVWCVTVSCACSAACCPDGCSSVQPCGCSVRRALLPAAPRLAMLCVEPAVAPCSYAADGSTDVFDPASWDDETRKQWEAFVSSSKVGRLGCPACFVWVEF